MKKVFTLSFVMFCNMVFAMGQSESVNELDRGVLKTMSVIRPDTPELTAQLKQVDEKACAGVKSLIEKAQSGDIDSLQQLTYDLKTNIFHTDVNVRIFSKTSETDSLLFIVCSRIVSDLNLPENIRLEALYIAAGVLLNKNPVALQMLQSAQVNPSIITAVVE